MPLAAGNDPQTISRNISELTHHGNQPRSHAQIIAIALSNADRHPHRASGGGIGFHPVSYHLMSAPKGMGSVASHVERPMNPSQGTPYWTRESLRDMGRSGIGRFAMGGAPASEMVPPTERASMRIMDQPFHGGLISSPVGGRTDRLPLNVPSDSHVIPADIMSGLNQGNSFGSDHLLNQVLGGGTGPYGVPDPKMIHGKGPPPCPAYRPKPNGFGARRHLAHADPGGRGRVCRAALAS